MNKLSFEKAKKKCDDIGLVFVRVEKSNVVFMCPHHHARGEISRDWSHFSRASKGCPYCTGRYKTTDQFADEIKRISPNIRVVGEYNGSEGKVLCRCLVDGYEWSPVARSLKNGQGCPMCARAKVAKVKRKPHDQFVEDMKAIDGNITIIGKYIRNKTPIRCMCRLHDCEWESYPSNLLNGSARCPRCAAAETQTSGERKMGSVLSDLGVEYVTQHSFSDCRITMPLRFDAYSEKLRMAFEYNGEGHYRPVDFAGKGEEWAEEAHKKVLKSDSIKRTYCRTHNIELLIIPFWEYDNMTRFVKDKVDRMVYSRHASPARS